MIIPPKIFKDDINGLTKVHSVSTILKFEDEINPVYISTAKGMFGEQTNEQQEQIVYNRYFDMIVQWYYDNAGYTEGIYDDLVESILEDPDHAWTFVDHHDLRRLRAPVS